MKFLTKKAAVIIIQLFLTVSLIFSHELSDLFFDITINTVSGWSKNPETTQYVELSKNGARLLMHMVWNNELNRPVFLYEMLQPSKAGLIDSAFVSGSSYYFDSNLWIESAILHVKESSNSEFANDILSQLDGKDDPAFSENEEESELINLSKDGSLRRYAFEGESFSLNEYDGLKYIVNVSDKELVRRIYNDEFKISKKQIFETPSASEQINLLKEIDYYYDQEGNLISQKEENKKNKTQTICQFDKNKKILEKKTGHYQESEESIKARQKKPELEVKYILVADQLTNWSYDDQNRISAVNTINYYYSKNNRGKTITSETSQRTVYTWGNISSSPDSMYYEDDELRIKTVHTAENDYTQTMYFEDDFTAVTEYKDHQKSEEIIYLNNVEMRRRSFEVFE